MQPLIKASEVRRQVQAVLVCGNYAARQVMKAEAFPRPVRVTERIARWRRYEVESYLQGLTGSNQPAA
jgi:predicted DNA-binding transcriptional regulator AlpA